MIILLFFHSNFIVQYTICDPLWNIKFQRKWEKNGKKTKGGVIICVYLPGAVIICWANNRIKHAMTRWGSADNRDVMCPCSNEGR